MMMRNACLAALLICYTTGNAEAQTVKKITGPHIIIYKTKADYRHLVPVLLSDDKKQIVSYPHPRDLKIKGTYALPSMLHKGYLLDNKGIGANVAFLKMTYEEYGKLQDPPSGQELYNMIADKDPLTTYCDCGARSGYKDPVKDINNLIDRRKLSRKCKVMR